MSQIEFIAGKERKLDRTGSSAILDVAGKECFAEQAMKHLTNLFDEITFEELRSNSPADALRSNESS
jgi:hypothetical protein